MEDLGTQSPGWAASGREVDPDIHLGLIIPLREEFDCARKILAFGQPVQTDQNVLYPFTVPGTTVRGVATVLFDVGMTTSAAVAARLLAAHEVTTLALVGIAGALDRELRLGDVVVASSVEEYLQAAKATSDPGEAGYAFTPAGTAWKPDSKLITYVRKLPVPGEFPGWFRVVAGAGGPAAGGYPRGSPPGLFRRQPDYFVLPVATGDVVAAAQPFADWLLRHNRRRAAVEMEAGGVAQAVYQHGHCDLLVVRGISDFADDRKAHLDAMASPGADAGAWRRYAALNAFDLFAALISNPGFPWRNLARERKRPPGRCLATSPASPAGSQSSGS